MKNPRWLYQFYKYDPEAVLETEREDQEAGRRMKLTENETMALESLVRESMDDICAETVDEYRVQSAGKKTQKKKNLTYYKMHLRRRDVT